MNKSKILRGIFFISIIGFVSLLAEGFTGWRPRFGLEAEFQQTISRAQIADHYRGVKGGGWDSENVTTKVCNRVDHSILTGLGLPVDDREFWPSPNVHESSFKPQDIWRINQDKGVIASCFDHSARFLEIAIDRHTLACTARVSVLPTCDP